MQPAWRVCRAKGIIIKAGLNGIPLQFTGSLVSAVAAVGMSCPADVLKSRMQNACQVSTQDYWTAPEHWRQMKECSHFGKVLGLQRSSDHTSDQFYHSGQSD